MQELILDLHGKPEDLASLELSSLMLFPNPKDNVSYRMWMLRQLLALAADRFVRGIEIGISPDEKIVLNKQIGSDLGEAIYHYGGWSALANATIGPGMKKPLQVFTHERLIIGKIVGMVLIYALANNRGIMWATEKVCGQVAKHETIRQNPNTFVKKTWPIWKSSAHLWAAYVNERSFKPKKLQRWLALGQLPGGIDEFVRQSEEFLESASKQMPPRGPRKTILSTETCWKILL